MKLIVGLGNPEEKYAKTRHNLGFELVDKLGHRLQGTGVSWKIEDKFKAQICNLKTETCNLILAKPQTYMNNSGVAVSLIAKFYKIFPEDIIVVHDELDLYLGKIKVRLGGSGAGHHGIESIIVSLGTDQFIRVRLGIRNDNLHSPEKFVLEEFLSNEKSEVRHMLKIATKVVEVLLKDGIEKSQSFI